MQHKAPIGLHRSAQIHRMAGLLGVEQRQVDLVKQFTQRDLSRFIDHHSHRPVLGMFTQVDHRPGKVRVGHIGHGNQEMVSQRKRVHFSIIA